MIINPSVIEVIRELEGRLRLPETRRSKAEVSKLLADEFIEYGSSGMIYTKKEVLASLAAESAAPGGDSPDHAASWTISNFQARELTPGIILATYYASWRPQVDKETATLHSSLWIKVDGSWQIVFHQGTPAHPHSHDHAHHANPAIENWRNSDLPYGKKLKLAMGNTWIKISKRQRCCGHPGEPGC